MPSNFSMTHGRSSRSRGAHLDHSLTCEREARVGRQTPCAVGTPGSRKGQPRQGGIDGQDLAAFEAQLGEQLARRNANYERLPVVRDRCGRVRNPKAGNLGRVSQVGLSACAVC